MTPIPATASAHRLSLCGPLWIQLYTGMPDTACIADMERILPSPLLPARYAMLVVFAQALRGRPDDETRRRTAKLLVAQEGRIAGAALVVEMPGLMGVAARMALSGLTMIAPYKHPEQTVATVDEGLAYLARTAPDLIGDDVVRRSGEVVREMRALARS